MSSTAGTVQSWPIRSRHRRTSALHAEPEPASAAATALHAATAEANTWCQARYDALNPLALKRLIQGGAVLRAFPQSILEACYKANTELMAEASAKSAPFKRMYESMMAFQRDQVAWFKVAEGGFDNFMSRQKL